MPANELKKILNLQSPSHITAFDNLSLAALDSLSLLKRDKMCAKDM